MLWFCIFMSGCLSAADLTLSQPLQSPTENPTNALAQEHDSPVQKSKVSKPLKDHFQNIFHCLL